MQVKKYLWVLYLITCSSFRENQYTTQSSKAIQLYQQAVIDYAQNEYKSAIQLLEQAIQKDKKFIEAYLQLATIQQQRDNFEQAIKLLHQAHAYLRKEKYGHLCYDLAALYYRSGAYQKAQEVLDTCPAIPTLPAALRAKLERLQKDVSFSLEKIKSPVAFNPKLLPAPLNQFSAQYFPVLTVDQKTLFFTARSDQTQGKENIYVSHKDPTGQWTVPQPLTGKINTQHNEGTCTISADGKMLVFTACCCKENLGICDLYVVHKKEGAWTSPENLGPNINTTGWESQPSLSADGQLLYFVSDRAENYGKKDIWKSTLQQDGTWSKAVNLGPVINREGCEVSPFIHPNGQTLFFSSDRCPSLGGLDIYYSHFVEDEWTTPVNLGYPINGHKDQTSLFITADGKKAYYADGNHKGANYYKSHLYEFDFPANLMRLPKSEFIKIQVSDEKTGKMLAAQVALYDVATGTQQSSRHVSPEDGELVVVVNEGKAYNIFIKKEGYLFESIHVDYKHHAQPVVTPNNQVLLKPIEVDQWKVLNHVFFDFDQATLDERADYRTQLPDRFSKNQSKGTHKN